jgi:anti-sigma B factor antagonist
MATPLEVSVGRDPDSVPVVVAGGEIDMSNAMQFREALGAAAADAADAAEGGGTGDFVVDLTRVEYLDSAGINALFVHVSRVRLIAAPLLVPVLTVAGLADVLSVREPSELVWRFWRGGVSAEGREGFAGMALRVGGRLGGATQVRHCGRRGGFARAVGSLTGRLGAFAYGAAF